MKNVIWILSLIIIVGGCSRPANEYRITGMVEGASPGWIVLSRVVNNDLVAIDSVDSNDGAISFTGIIDMPEAYFLEFKADQKFVRFFVEPGDIEVSGHVNDPIFEGAETQEIYKGFGKEIDRLDSLRNALYEEFKAASDANDSDLLEQIRDKAMKIDEDQHAFTIDFIKSNNNNPVGPYIAINNIYQFELDELKDMRSTFTPAIASSKYVGMVDEQIQKIERVAIGMPAPNFTQNDTVGNPVSLNQFKGKYLLIDFWASWCSPCRRENPNVVAAYQKFHDMGFDILGVSLDQHHGRWVDAIAEDNLTWTQVSDLKGWQNEVSNQYGVSSIPANFLLDTAGVIIAKDLREEKLHAKLEEIFN